MIRLLCATVVASSLFASPGFAGVLKDHVSDSSLFDGQPAFLHRYPESFNQPTLAGVASVFTGNGRVLSRVGGVFATTGADGSLNTGEIGRYDFRISFFETLAEYLADPYGESLSGGSVLTYFGAPTNPDFMIPIGEAEQGNDLLYWEFDIEGLGIETTAGQTHLLLIHPEVGVLEGGTGIALSTGGAGAIGSQADYFRSEPIDAGPSLLSELLPLSPFAAYRIETVSIPEPSTSVLGALLLIAYASKTRCPCERD